MVINTKKLCSFVTNNVGKYPSSARYKNRIRKVAVYDIVNNSPCISSYTTQDTYRGIVS